MELESGEKLINISATTLAFNTINTMLEKVQDSIVSSIETQEESELKNFVVYVSKMRKAPLIMYYSFSVAKDDVFYQPLDSDDWNSIFSHYSYEEPENTEKFLK